MRSVVLLHVVCLSLVAASATPASVPSRSLLQQGGAKTSRLLLETEASADDDRPDSTTHDPAEDKQSTVTRDPAEDRSSSAGQDTFGDVEKREDDQSFIGRRDGGDESSLSSYENSPIRQRGGGSGDGESDGDVEDGSDRGSDRTSKPLPLVGGPPGRTGDLDDVERETVEVQTGDVCSRCPDTECQKCDCGSGKCTAADEGGGAVAQFVAGTPVRSNVCAACELNRCFETVWWCKQRAGQGAASSGGSRPTLPGSRGSTDSAVTSPQRDTRRRRSTGTEEANKPKAGTQTASFFVPPDLAEAQAPAPEAEIPFQPTEFSTFVEDDEDPGPIGRR